MQNFNFEEDLSQVNIFWIFPCSANAISFSSEHHLYDLENLSSV